MMSVTVLTRVPAAGLNPCSCSCSGDLVSLGHCEHIEGALLLAVSAWMFVFTSVVHW